MKKITLLIIFIASSNFLVGQQDEFAFHFEDSKIFKIKQKNDPIAHFPFEYLYTLLGKDLGQLNRSNTYNSSILPDGSIEFIPNHRSFFTYNSDNKLVRIDAEVYTENDWEQRFFFEYNYTLNTLEELVNFYEDDGTISSDLKTVYNYDEEGMIESYNLFSLNGGNENLLRIEEYTISADNKLTTEITTLMNGVVLNQKFDEYIFVGDGSQLFYKTRLDENYEPTDGYQYAGDNEKITIESDTRLQKIIRDVDGLIDEIIYYYKEDQGNGWFELIEESKLDFEYIDNTVFIIFMSDNKPWKKYEYHFTPQSTVSNQNISEELTCKLINPITKGQDLQCLELADANINFYNELGQLIGSSQADNFGNFNINSVQQSGLIFLSALTTKGQHFHHKLMLME